jgi:hypothetical protein
MEESPAILEDETHNKQQQLQPSVTRTGHSEVLLGQSVARFDAKPLAVAVLEPRGVSMNGASAA